MNGNGFPASGTDLPRSELVSGSTADPGPEAGEIDFRQILDALARRRRLAVAVLAASLLLGGGFTAYQRAFRPLFAGSFKLLISDPIGSEDLGSKGGGIEQVALPGSGSTNAGTLIQVLTSPLLLAPIEQSLGLNEGILAPTITAPKAAAGMGMGRVRAWVGGGEACLAPMASAWGSMLAPGIGANGSR